MKETSNSFSIPIGKSKRVSVLNGTQEIWEFKPDPTADVIISINITEQFPDKKE